jgi:hypothetical protein
MLQAEDESEVKSEIGGQIRNPNVEIRKALDEKNGNNAVISYEAQAGEIRNWIEHRRGH